MENYDRLENEILKKLLSGKKAPLQKDIMSYLHDVKNLPSHPARCVQYIHYNGRYFQMKFDSIFENSTTTDQNLLQLLTWNNFMKRSSEALKDISCIDFKPVESYSEVKFILCECGKSFKKRAHNKHKKKCGIFQIKKQEQNEEEKKRQIQ